MGNQVALSSSREKQEDSSEHLRRPGHKTVVDSASLPSRTSLQHRSTGITPNPDDLVGATPYPRSDERSITPRRVDLRVFPSFRGGLDNGSKDSQTSVIYSKKPIVNVRIYRRSGSLGRSDRDLSGGSVENTLRPRYKILRRSRSSAMTGTLPDSQTGTIGTTGTAKDSTLKSTESERYLNTGPASEFASSSNAGVKLASSAETVKGKVASFETFFITALMSQYRTLSSYAAQMKLISVAIHLRHGHQRHVTLYRYLIKRDVPTQLLLHGDENNGEYIVTIPDALFYVMMQLRQRRETADSATAESVEISLGEEIVLCLSVEAATEISRMFEYQISLMPNHASIQLLADHAVECAVSYASKGKGIWDRNNIVRGVVFGHLDAAIVKSDISEGDLNVRRTSRLISVKFNNRNLQWDLHEIFKKTGLRMDRLLVGGECLANGSTPWEFHTSTLSDPLLYGYRGIMIDWDYFAQAYTIVVEDWQCFNEKVLLNPQDYHQQYAPYRALIGTDVMENYCIITTKDKGSLCDFINRKHGVNFNNRINIQPVYRPLKAFSVSSAGLKYANFDGVDLTRIHLTGADLRRTSFHGTLLRLARLSGALLDRAESCRGADISYSHAQDAVLNENVLDVVASSRYTLVGFSSEEAATSQKTPVAASARSDLGVRNVGVLVCDHEGNVKDIQQAIRDLGRHFEVPHYPSVKSHETIEIVEAFDTWPKRKTRRRTSKEKYNHVDEHPTIKIPQDVKLSTKTQSNKPLLTRNSEIYTNFSELENLSIPTDIYDPNQPDTKTLNFDKERTLSKVPHDEIDSTRIQPGATLHHNDVPVDITTAKLNTQKVNNTGLSNSENRSWEVNRTSEKEEMQKDNYETTHISSKGIVKIKKKAEKQTKTTSDSVNLQKDNNTSDTVEEMSKKDSNSNKKLKKVKEKKIKKFWKKDREIEKLEDEGLKSFEEKSAPSRNEEKDASNTIQIKIPKCLEINKDIAGSSMMEERNASCTIGVNTLVKLEESTENNTNGKLLSEQDICSATEKDTFIDSVLLKNEHSSNEIGKNDTTISIHGSTPVILDESNEINSITRIEQKDTFTQTEAKTIKELLVTRESDAIDKNEISSDISDTRANCITELNTLLKREGLKERKRNTFSEIEEKPTKTSLNICEESNPFPLKPVVTKERDTFSEQKMIEISFNKESNLLPIQMEETKKKGNCYKNSHR